MQSFIQVTDASDFTIHNIPFGLYSRRSDESKVKHVATRIGDTVVDLHVLASSGLLSESGNQSTVDALKQDSLANLAACSAIQRRAIRLKIQSVLAGDRPSLFPQDALVDASEVEMHVPMRIGDYTDFCIA